VSALPAEAPSPPWVELHVRQPLSPQERLALAARNSSADPILAWTTSLLAVREEIIPRIRKELVDVALLDETVIRQALDIAWTAAFPSMHRATGPMIAEAYIRAFRQAESGQVPIQMIYALAEEHARRVGGYFHETSSDALIQGFNTYVNRRVPQRAALERVLDAYGLTPRQMSGLTSAKQFDDKIESSLPRRMKQKMLSYIGKSIRDRLKIFAKQETHNLDEQAKQVAWMWMVQHGKLPETAVKMWLTAKDEKVCPVCGPLHGMKVGIGEKFTTDDGKEYFVPGAHVNCRCSVRLMINPFESVKKDLEGRELFEFNQKHPRGQGGRFARKPETKTADPRRVDPRVEQMIREAQNPGPEPQRQPQREPTAPEPLPYKEPVAPAPGLEEALAEERERAEAERLLAEAQRYEKKPRALGRPLGRTLGRPITGRPVGRPIEIKSEARALGTPEGGRALKPSVRPVPVEVQARVRGLRPAEARQVETARAYLDARKLFAHYQQEAEQRIARKRKVREAELYTPVAPFGQTSYYIGDDIVISTARDEDAPMGKAQFRDTQMHPLDEGELARLVQEKYEENVSNLVDELMYGEANTITRQDPEVPGRMLRHTFTEEELEGILQDAGMSMLPGATPGAAVEIDWYDENNEFAEISNAYYPDELVKSFFSMDIDSFAVKLYEADEGYDTEDFGTEFNGKAYTIEGPFRVVSDSYENTYVAPMRRIVVEPIVETTLRETTGIEPEAEVVEDEVIPWREEDRRASERRASEEWDRYRNNKRDWPHA